MAPSSPHVFVFDLMDTVVRDPFFADVPKILGIENLALMVQHRDPACWPAFERGVLSEEAFFAQFYQADAPEGLPKANTLKEAIVENYRLVEGMEQLLHGLGAGSRLWALSNYPIWFERLRRKLELDRFFSGYSISCYTGHRKPEPQAYQEVERTTLCSASQLVLVDDRKVNCDAARERGWRALHFRSAEQLRPALAQFGVTISATD